jgi:hypothetical protein
MKRNTLEDQQTSNPSSDKEVQQTYNEQYNPFQLHDYFPGEFLQETTTRTENNISTSTVITSTSSRSTNQISFDESSISEIGEHSFMDGFIPSYTNVAKKHKPNQKENWRQLLGKLSSDSFSVTPHIAETPTLLTVTSHSSSTNTFSNQNPQEMYPLPMVNSNDSIGSMYTSNPALLDPFHHYSPPTKQVDSLVEVHHNSLFPPNILWPIIAPSSSTLSSKVENELNLPSTSSYFSTTNPFAPVSNNNMNNSSSDLEVTPSPSPLLSPKNVMNNSSPETRFVLREQPNPKQRKSYKNENR